MGDFRRWLQEHGHERVVEQVVAYLGEKGYVKARGKQRTDATHILGAVARLSRLALVRESIRLALGALVSADAPWVLK